MFINRLNQLYKPKRDLYYRKATEADKAAFAAGKISDDIAVYTNIFGAYDYPGLFYIDSIEDEVIGIELRPDDDRIEYPTGLQRITLHPSFFYSIEIEARADIDKEYIQKLFIEIAKDQDALRAYSDLSVMEKPGIIGVFLSDRKIRIIYEFTTDSDRAMDIIKGNVDALDKNMLYNMAFFDHITGHYNWNHLVPYLEMPMDDGIEDYAFLHFDIKEFKVINELYGHTVANDHLKRVVDAMNEADFIYTSARCHNDNFAVMVKDMPRDELREKLTQFFDGLSRLEEDPHYRIYYRCGVVPMLRSMLSGNRVADAAKMAQALGTSRNKTDIVFYTDEMHNDVMWGSYIKAYEDTAIENDEFLVYLQPKFDIHTEKIKGSEALIRWNYKKKEFLSPGKFIPFFERDGSIGKIDDIVLTKVCGAFDKWRKEGRILYPVSVNLSRDRLYDKNLVDHLTEIVDSYGVYHDLIDFELTESASYDNTEQMIRVLNELRDRGFHISMDDFGTGYSSFSLLTQMPLDTLKIDKSFVDKVGVENMIAKDIAVIRHIISLAKELGFVCLAEGAESKQQIDELRSLGCDVIQGYYYSKPVSIEEYENKYLN